MPQADVYALLQLLGAVLILVAFIAVQLGRTDPRSYFSLTLNLVGSALLAWLAFEDSQFGFLLLEFVWAVVSGWGLGQRLLSQRSAP
ncbi:MAG: hypothetical protein M3P40_10750 [Actinomycetota bacterium]|nr:hypothetical protein [Actinomycetota bacterium]